MCSIASDGRVAWIGLPERETAKIHELRQRGEIGLQMSVEVRAPVVVGIFPMRIARYVTGAITNGNGLGLLRHGTATAQGTGTMVGNGAGANLGPSERPQPGYPILYEPK
jgi:hypothetical protein